MYFRIIATLALSFVFYIGSSQESYHRLYETSLDDQTGMNDTIFFHMNSTTTSGDVYAMGTKRLYSDPVTYEDLSVIFTKHDDKGNIDWSKELDLGKDTITILTNGSTGSFAFNGTQDSILFTIDIEINGERSELFGKMDAGGSEIDLKTVGGLPFTLNTGFPQVTSFINQSDLLVTSGIQPVISRIGLGDDLIWSRSYEFENSAGDSILNFITDITTTADTSIVLTGRAEGLAEQFLVAELDSNGVQLWAESYTFPGINPTSILPTEVTTLSNGNIAVVGNYSMVGSPIFSTNGFVAIIDTVGSILLSKKVFITENSTGITNIIEAADGTLWMSGIFTKPDSTLYFTTNMDLEGNINWTTIYPNQEVGVSGPFSTSLLGVQSTGGASLIGHGTLDDLEVMQVMKHNPIGETLCSDTIPIIIEDLAIMDDTLTSSVDNGGIFLDSINFEFETFSGFSVPILSIEPLPDFCPNKFIDTFLIASVSGNVSEENISYLWSTGETNDTINILVEPMMMPQYTVTVTIFEDECYKMCDTINITRSTQPGATISQDDSRYCEERIIVLTANYAPGVEVESYIWSNDETTPTIEVMDVGPYSVTITDTCDDAPEANDFDVNLPTYNPEAQFGANVNNFCETGSAVLTASYQGGGDEPVFEWSDGQVGNPIFINTPGEYTLMVSDECGLEAPPFTLDVNFPEIPTTATISAEPNCELNKIIFSTTDQENINLVIFEIDDNGDRTPVVANQANSYDLGNYVVFARDFCNDDVDSFFQNSTAICGGLIDFPIAFFPGGQDEDSKTFGPIPNDTLSVGELISDIEFKVFNRWGETVFESNDLLDAWDGTHKGDPAPSEVYIWYMSYIVEEVQFIDKGDVTLIR